MKWVNRSYDGQEQSTAAGCLLTWEQHVAVYGPVLVVASYLCWRMLRRIRGSEFMELAASLQDDSFNGLLPAFRFWTAGQFTFDGLGPSYGFQPAYECVLTLLAYFFDDEQSFIRGAMELNVLFYALTGVVVSALVARCLRAGSSASLFAQKIAAAASGILFLTTGTALLSATTCKENALSSLLLALALLWIPARAASKPRSRKSARRAFLFGALLATLVLTRLLPTTLVLVTVLSLLAVRRTGAWALFAAGAILPLAAWAAIALCLFGQVVPTSARVKAASQFAIEPLAALKWGAKYAYHAMRFATGGQSSFHLPQSDAAVAGDGAAFSRSPVVVAAAAVLVLLVRTIAHFRRNQEPKSGWAATEGAVALCAAATLAVYPLQGALLSRHRGSELFYYTWYVFDLPLLFCVALGACAVAALAALEKQRVVRRNWRVLSPSAVLVLLASTTAPTCLRGLRYLRNAAPYSAFDWQNGDWEHSMLRAGFWLRDNVELGPDERVACVSCGALGLVFPDRLLALDGLASDEAAS